MLKMSDYKLHRYQPKYYGKWNIFVEESNNGTLFHRLDFLEYHKDRFAENENNLLIFKGDSVFGIIPLAFFEETGKRIAKSPFGGSYGGFVFKTALSYKSSKLIIAEFIRYLQDIGIDETYITPAINDFCLTPCDTFIFSMLEAGFKISNSEITSIVPLSKEDITQSTFTSRARNAIRKAKSEEIEVVRNANIDDFWSVMTKTFARHGKNPTHTRDEFIYLNKIFPDRVYCDLAYYRGVPIAGIGYMKINKRTNSSFYLCSDEEYIHKQALSLLISNAVVEAQNDGFAYFDFGTSSVNMVGRNNIFLFKESFGATGRFRNTYQLKLK
jgi:hypothetical protein